MIEGFLFWSGKMLAEVVWGLMVILGIAVLFVYLDIRNKRRFKS